MDSLKKLTKLPLVGFLWYTEITYLYTEWSADSDSEILILN